MCYPRHLVTPLLDAIEQCDWCCDVLTRRALKPVEVPVVGQVRQHHAVSATHRVTFEQLVAEEAVWSSGPGSTRA